MVEKQNPMLCLKQVKILFIILIKKKRKIQINSFISIFLFETFSELENFSDDFGSHSQLMQKLIITVLVMKF